MSSRQLNTLGMSSNTPRANVNSLLLFGCLSRELGETQLHSSCLQDSMIPGFQDPD